MIIPTRVSSGYQIGSYNIPMVFKKGQPGWNKGNRIKGEWRDCQLCGTRKWFINFRIINGGGKFCSRTCSNRVRAMKKGPEHWNYKGSMTYGAVHDWLKDNFEKPTHCVKCNKKGESKNGKWTIQWALIHGKKYERKVENFRHLCARCHVLYDETIPCVSKGVPVPPERRKKISEGLKRYFASL